MADLQNGQHAGWLKQQAGVHDSQFRAAARHDRGRFGGLLLQLLLQLLLELTEELLAVRNVRLGAQLLVQLCQRRPNDIELRVGSVKLEVGFR